MICIWDVWEYQHCMKSVRKYMIWIIMNYLIIFIQYLYEINTCNKAYMNLIDLILTGDLWPSPLTINPLKAWPKSRRKHSTWESHLFSQQLKEKPRCDPFHLDESWQLAWLGISGAIMDYKFWPIGWTILRLKMTQSYTNITMYSKFEHFWTIP